MHNVADGLHGLLTEIEPLVLDPKNARSHNERSIRSIAESLREFTQRKPIIVQKSTNIVIAGNGTLQAAQSLGWTQIAALFVDDDQAKATAYAIADNKTAELSEWNDDALGAALKFLQEESDYDYLGVTGFSTEELDKWIPDANQVAAEALAATEETKETEKNDEPKATEDKVGKSPTLKFGEWTMYMDESDAEILEAKIKEYSRENGSTLGFAALLVRAV